MNSFYELSVLASFHFLIRIADLQLYTMPKRLRQQHSTSTPIRKRRQRINVPPPAAIEPSTPFTFRTLAGTHTIDVRVSSAREAALARFFGVDARRIVLQMLDDEACVMVLEPFYIQHHGWSPEYRSPPGFMDLCRLCVDAFDCEEEMHWSYISHNPAAFELLAEHLDKVDWKWFSANPHPGAAALLAANLDKVDWKLLSANPGAIDILDAHWSHIELDELSSNTNPKALEWLGIDEIQWSALSGNTSSAAIDTLTANMDVIDWKVLSANNSAIQLLTANQDKIDWSELCLNLNAIELLCANPERICWPYFFMNPSACQMLADCAEFDGTSGGKIRSAAFDQVADIHQFVDALGSVWSSWTEKII
jgi:hypothetical protein